MATNTDELTRCPECGLMVSGKLGTHIRREHGYEALRLAVLKEKKAGKADALLGARFGISRSQLERIIMEAYGINVSTLGRPKRVRQWQPPAFKQETSTVWSFKRRGDWATHDGRYRGNWSPYIPRNVILRYSRPGDMVLDYFVGGGTTAVEAKLLGRRCLALDINPEAVRLTQQNLAFEGYGWHLHFDGIVKVYEPDVREGDARNLSAVASNSVDLICAHPPYAGIIKYGSHIEGDLSDLTVEDFLEEIRKVARESLRVLKPGGRCAILIGDARKSKRVIPIGFRTIRVFLEEGWDLEDLVIKRQHNCKTTGFWYDRSISYNFLLLAHEYLPIFLKPESSRVYEKGSTRYQQASLASCMTSSLMPSSFETTTVWVFPPDQMDEAVKRNLAARFCPTDHQFIEVTVGAAAPKLSELAEGPDLIYVNPPSPTMCEDPESYRRALVTLLSDLPRRRSSPTVVAIDTKDLRVAGRLIPLGYQVWNDLSTLNGAVLRELVVVAPDDSYYCVRRGGDLEIVHRYLLIYDIACGRASGEITDGSPHRTRRADRPPDTSAPRQCRPDWFDQGNANQAERVFLPDL